MRIARTLFPDGERLAIEADGALHALHASRSDLFELLASGVDGAAWEVGETIPAGPRLAPGRPGKIVAIGLNYRDHCREAGLDVPASPIVFTKFSSSIIGPEDEIVIDRDVTTRVDWEVELGVVIGRRAVRVEPRDALAHVFGYTVVNDVSARDVQFGDGQWVRGKSLDTFCPLGPVVVTADEIADPHALGLRTRVNGDTVQDLSTSEMVFDVAALIAFCSRSFPLEPGDVIATGTPWGCGEFMDPPRSLTDGDVVECEIDGIGTRRNPVKETTA